MPLSEADTFKYIAQVTLDEHTLESMAELIKKRNKGLITAMECEMFTTVERSKCYDKIFQQDSVTEM